MPRLSGQGQSRYDQRRCGLQSCAGPRDAITTICSSPHATVTVSSSANTPTPLRPAIAPFDLVVVWVVSTGLVSVGLLALGWFEPLFAALFGTFPVIVLARWHAPRGRVFTRRDVGLLLFVFAVALVFRLPPSLHVTGGQDQGTYVNMSGYYRHHGSTFVHDRVRARLRSDRLRRYYDEANQLSVAVKPAYPGRAEGAHRPGLYVRDIDRSEYVFQFYPLHPLWMAIFGGLLGQAHSAYSLTLFSLLSLTFLFLLARDLAGRLAAVFCGVFVALNPLHAYFSKFPTTEIVSLALSSGAFWYLLRFHRLGPTRDGKLCLAISAGLFGCLFFNHIAGFIYLPLLGVLFLMVCTRDAATYRAAATYLLAATLLYLLSAAYGWHFSFPYAYDIYKEVFTSVLGPGWRATLPYWIGSAAVAVLVGALAHQRLGRLVWRHRRILGYLPAVGMAAVVSFALWRAYQLGFTTRFADDPFISGRFHIAGRGWDSLPYTNLWVLGTYLTPFGVLLLALSFAHFRPPRATAAHTALLAFIVTAAAFRLVGRFVTPYHYYYTRYLAGEVLPYSLLLISLYLSAAHAKLRRPTVYATICAAVLLTINSIYNLAFQLRGRPDAGAYESLSRLAGHVGDRDLLLVAGHPIRHNSRSSMPLDLFFDRDLFSAFRVDDVPSIINEELRTSGYERILVLSVRQRDEPWLKELEHTTWRYGIFERVHRAPKRFYFGGRDLFLHQVLLPELPRSGFDDRPVALRPSRQRLRLKNFVDRYWTNGDGRISDLDLPVPAGCRHLVLITLGYQPFRGDPAKLDLAVLVNGRQLQFLRRNGVEFWFRWPPGLTRLHEVAIRSATFVPAETGTNPKDFRRLGMDVLSIEVRR